MCRIMNSGRSELIYRAPRVSADMLFSVSTAGGGSGLAPKLRRIFAADNKS